MHLFQITERLGMLATGMPADGRALAQQARSEAAEFCYKWGYEMPPKMLVQWMGDTAQVRTQNAGLRTYSFVATVVGSDEEKGTPELFTCDPAGQVLGHKDPLLDTTDSAFTHLFQFTERPGILATRMPVATVVGIDEENGTPELFTCDPAGQVLGHKDPLPDTTDPTFMHLFQITERLGILATVIPVATLMGIDEEKGTPELFTCDPAGQVLGHKSHVCSKIRDEGMHSSIYMLHTQKSKCSAMKKTAWKMDSGSTFHATGYLHSLQNLRQAPKQGSNCRNASGRSFVFHYMGDVLEPNVRLKEVRYSDRLGEDDQLISIPQLTSSGYAIQMGNGRFTIHDAMNMNYIVGNGHLDEPSMSYRVDFFNGMVLQPKKRCKKASKGGKLQINEDSFVLDSGCPHHLTNSKSNQAFKRMETKKDFTKVGYHTIGGGYLRVTSEGDVICRNFLLKNVYDCATTKNLCSLPQLDLSGYQCLFIDDHCHITWKGEEIGRATQNKADDMLYYIVFFRAQD